MEQAVVNSVDGGDISTSRESEYSRAGDNSRDADNTRNADLREKTPYRPTRILQGVAPKEGYVRKFITTSVLGQNVDATMKFADGWVPVLSKDYPGHPYATIDFGGFEGVISMGGMVLCEMPKERNDEINEYHADRARRAEKSIKTTLVGNVEGLKDESGEGGFEKVGVRHVNRSVLE